MTTILNKVCILVSLVPGPTPRFYLAAIEKRYKIWEWPRDEASIHCGTKLLIILVISYRLQYSKSSTRHDVGVVSGELRIEINITSIMYTLANAVAIQ